MLEREIISNVIDFAFIIKAQLHSEESALLRSILSIAIMECEDLLDSGEYDFIEKTESTS